MQKSLLAPVRQWCAHESRISSIAAASYRGKADLIVTAGEDCYVHLWTVAGALVGTFGQVTVDNYQDTEVVDRSISGERGLRSPFVAALFPCRTLSLSPSSVSTLFSPLHAVHCALADWIMTSTCSASTFVKQTRSATFLFTHVPTLSTMGIRCFEA